MEGCMNILIVEDDGVIAEGLSYALTDSGYGAHRCATYTAAIQEVAAAPYDLYLLDLSLPDGSGYDLCRLIKQNHHAPVLFLTAVSDEGNVVRGLDMGADDYITKPFRIRELISRIHTAMRHYQNTPGALASPAPGPLQTGGISVYSERAKVYKNGAEITLTALEYRLLLTFIEGRGRVFTRAQILESLWDVAGNFVNDNTLSVYIKRLRDKLEDDPQNPALIETVRGLGYRMREEKDAT